MPPVSKSSRLRAPLPLSWDHEHTHPWKDAGLRPLSRGGSQYHGYRNSDRELLLLGVLGWGKSRGPLLGMVSAPLGGATAAHLASGPVRHTSEDCS